MNYDMARLNAGQSKAASRPGRLETTWTGAAHRRTDTSPAQHRRPPSAPSDNTSDKRFLAQRAVQLPGVQSNWLMISSESGERRPGRCQVVILIPCRSPPVPVDRP